MTIMAALGVLTLGLLSGCNDSDEEKSGSDTSSEDARGQEGDDEDLDHEGHDHESGDGHDHDPVGLTPEALAAVALEHVEEEPRVGRRMNETEHGAGEGVRFQFGETPSDTTTLNVSVAPPEESSDCSQDTEDADGCEELDVDGQTVYVLWEEEAPDEGPGLVVVWTEREGEFVGTYYAGDPTDGDTISGDPREQDLLIDVEEMVDIVTDERLTLAPSDDVLALGDDLDLQWGERAE